MPHASAREIARQLAGLCDRCDRPVAHPDAELCAHHLRLRHARGGRPRRRALEGVGAAEAAGS